MQLNQQAQLDDKMTGIQSMRHPMPTHRLWPRGHAATRISGLWYTRAFNLILSLENHRKQQKCKQHKQQASKH